MNKKSTRHYLYSHKYLCVATSALLLFSLGSLAGCAAIIDSATKIVSDSETGYDDAHRCIVSSFYARSHYDGPFHAASSSDKDIHEYKDGLTLLRASSCMTFFGYLKCGTDTEMGTFSNGLARRIVCYTKNSVPIYLTSEAAADIRNKDSQRESIDIGGIADKLIEDLKTG